MFRTCALRAGRTASTAARSAALLPRSLARTSFAPARAVLSSSHAISLAQQQQRTFGVTVRALSTSNEDETKAEKVQEPEETIVPKGEAKSHAFQAETRKLLDIVANSLYSEKEVFVRELISNAADALEKLRYLQASGKEIADPDLPLEIKLSIDSAAGTFTIHDTGIGMDASELVKNLGTIAHSGSKSFVETVGKEQGGSAAKQNIIGQFGVGFYAGFMVGEKITVTSRSASKIGDAGNIWESDGSGEFTVTPAEGMRRGTKIVIKLRDTAKEFSDAKNIENIIQKYSNFVGFPISLNGERINTIEPLWTMPASKVTEEQHSEFYRFIANAFDVPAYHLHYSADAPIHVRSLFYFPEMQTEKFGMGRMEPGVSLYCRKVLIKAKSDKLLPEWLRFVRGVVDSEDIPLNLSREILQDSALIGRISRLLTGRIVKFLSEEMKKDLERYKKWYAEFSNFLREGVCTDTANRTDLLKLMLYESSGLEAGKVTTLAEYVARMPADQKQIYYVVAADREVAESSPYLESLRRQNREVLFMYEALDDVVMVNAREFDGKQLVSIESSDLSLDHGEKAKGPLSDEEEAQLKVWMETVLGVDKIKEIRASNRLVDSPAILVDHDPATLRKMMKMIDKGRVTEKAYTMEVNMSHPLIVKLNEARKTVEAQSAAKLVAEQLFDNCLIAAGHMDEPRSMVKRLTDIMGLALNTKPAAETKAN